MTDIIDRIKSLRYVHVPQASQLFEEAIAEIERLRLAIRRLADQDATLSLLCKRDGSQVVTVTMNATLTDAEREAIHFMFRHAAQAADHDPFPDSTDYIPHHKVISAMMERLK